ncbi:MAG: response regulator [Actinobacteria bacterium]|nr:response regulator [Actinomycetota bacterium]
MGSAGEGKRILYIEDDPEMARLVARLLVSEGYDVIEAERGTRGLDFLYESFPHLVLLDLRMAIMSGYEFLEAMKAQSGLREIPVVCVTGLIGLDRVQEAFLRGADGYVMKPVDFDFLSAVIAFLTTRASLEEKAPVLLGMAGMEEAARLVGYGIDSLEKMDVILTMAETGKKGYTATELASRLGLRHEDLATEVRELVRSGVLEEGEKGRLRLIVEGEWGARCRAVQQLPKKKQALEAFVNGVYTGVLAYALATGYFEQDPQGKR